MGIFRSILLTVGLIWAVLFRIYPSVAGLATPNHAGPQVTVQQDTHPKLPSTDSAVFLMQDEDEHLSPSVSSNPDFLPPVSVEWMSLLLALLVLQPVHRMAFRAKPASARPYYLLYCSLRIPAV